jgi:hypothetical protein
MIHTLSRSEAQAVLDDIVAAETATDEDGRQRQHSRRPRSAVVDDDDDEMSVDSDSQSQGLSPSERDRLLAHAHAVITKAHEAQPTPAPARSVVLTFSFEAQRRGVGRVTFDSPALAGRAAPPTPARSKRQLPAAAPPAKRTREVEESDPALMLRTLEQWLADGVDLSAPLMSELTRLRALVGPTPPPTAAEVRAAQAVLERAAAASAAEAATARAR